jgi:hypothetical protein
VTICDHKNVFWFGLGRQFATTLKKCCLCW